MGIADDYRAKANDELPPSLEGLIDEAAAILLARNLMQSNPTTFKRGYTLENAAMAAHDVFPNIKLSEIIVWVHFAEPTTRHNSQAGLQSHVGGDTR